MAEKTCHRIYCGDDWRSHIKKIVPETGGCADDCSDYKYENNNYCYSTCPEGANFCTPDPGYIETTNIITTYNNEIDSKETTNIMITTDKIEEKKVISSLNYYIDSSSKLISEKNIIKTLTTANYEGKTTIDIVTPISSYQKYNLITDKTDNKNLIPFSSLQTNSNDEDDSIENKKNDKTYLIAGENNEVIYEEIKDILVDYDHQKKQL